MHVLLVGAFLALNISSLSRCVGYRYSFSESIDFVWLLYNGRYAVYI